MSITAQGELAALDGTSDEGIETRHPFVIEATKRWTLLSLREIWDHRELLWLLAWRDIKVHYTQTTLGILWAILQPLTTMIVFALLFGRFTRMPSDGVPYPIFAYAGLLPWTFLSNSVIASSNSLVGNSALITRVYFPRAVIPASSIVASLVDFGVSFLILFVMMDIYNVWPGGVLLLLVPLIILTVAAALGVGLLLSALNVTYRDVRHAVPFIIQVWFYLTPVIYPVSLVPARYRWLLALNPICGTVASYRSALLNRPIDWASLELSAVTTIAILLGGSWLFARMEAEFADIV